MPPKTPRLRNHCSGNRHRQPYARGPTSPAAISPRQPPERYDEQHILPRTRIRERDRRPGKSRSPEGATAQSRRGVCSTGKPAPRRSAVGNCIARFRPGLEPGNELPPAQSSRWRRGNCADLVDRRSALCSDGSRASQRFAHAALRHAASGHETTMPRATPSADGHATTATSAEPLWSGYAPRFPRARRDVRAR